MTTANMEVNARNRMFCKLLLLLYCTIFVLSNASASNVVSFQQEHLDLNADAKTHARREVRSKRSTETESERADSKCDSQKDKFQTAISDNKRLETTHVFKDETKFSLAMAWAGKNDDGVLVVLTSELIAFQFAASTLWRSNDFGRTWANISSKVENKGFRKNDGLQRNPHDPKWIYLISNEHFMFKSEDGGENWKKIALAGIVKNELIFHEEEKYKDHVLVITDNNELIMTRNNFDDTDTVKDSGVHSAHWGSESTSSATDMFVAFDKTMDHSLSHWLDGKVTYYELLRRSAHGGEWKKIQNYMADFSLQGDFLYASVYQEEPDMNSERKLVVSNDGGNHWTEAQLSTLTRDRFFSVLDMSEHLIFMHVDNPGDTGHGTLYTSWSKGIMYSKSLENHLYPNYNSITDFYKVSSMRGTYMASQLTADNSIHSVITFDLGAEWKPLPKPEGVPCKDEGEECSLQIHNEYSLHRGIKAFRPLSTADAPGLIIVNAHAAKNLQITDPDVFVSSNGGYTWRKALDGPHAYVIADSGGLIVAISIKDAYPKEVKFSTDEGRCWHVYQFTTEKIHHTGLLTEPGGKSMTVAIWGYTDKDKKWTVSVIDFADVITDHCQRSDYEDWIPHETMKQDDARRKGCLLGRRTTFQRLKHDSWCHNGYQYKPESSDITCPCGFEDYECDYGFMRLVGQEKCVVDPSLRNLPEIDICFRGHEEKVISKGYRKLPGDVCDGQKGFHPSSQLINLTETCSGRITPSPGELLKEQEETSHKTLIVTLILMGLIIVSIALAYFGYKMVLLRRHKVVYRYSMLSQTNENDDKNYNDEIERTLQPSPMFGETSDEEELPSEPHRSRLQKSRVRGFHDDSDDDMLD